MTRLVAVLVGAALLLMGCGTAVPGVPGPAPALAPPTQVADPVGVEIPKIGVRASLIGTGDTPGGGWETPPLDQPMQPSWYQPGPEPGEPGAAVILGHVNGQHREGVFARLTELAPGDRIVVLQTEGQIEFEVTSSGALPKDQWDPQAVLSPTQQPELFLITCTGELERTARGGRHLDNWIVSARPV